MRRRLAIILLSGFLVNATSAAVETWTLSNWQSLKAGMAEEQVIQQLGNPIDHKESKLIKIWSTMEIKCTRTY